MIFAFCLLLFFFSFVAALDVSSFNDPTRWVQTTDVPEPTQAFRFFVALVHRNLDQMRDEFLSVSTPGHALYGKHQSLSEINEKYAPSQDSKDKVRSWIKSNVIGAIINTEGNMIEVKATVSAVEKGFKTKLNWHESVRHPSDKKKRDLRATADLVIPASLHDSISFTTLNAPINMGKWRGHSSKDSLYEKAKDAQSQTAATLSYTAGNDDALVKFQPICGDGSVNNFSPPCANLAANYVPVFTAIVQSYHNNKKDHYSLSTPTDILFEIPPASIYCYNVSVFFNNISVFYNKIIPYTNYYT